MDEDKSGRPPRRRGALKFRTEPREAVGEFGCRHGWIFGAKRTCDLRRLSYVGVAFLRRQWPTAVVLECGQETVDLDDVDPQQEVRIVGCIGRAVRCGADDALVYGVDDVDGALGHLLGPECRFGEERTRALQPAPGIATKSRMPVDCRHRERVE